VEFGGLPATFFEDRQREIDSDAATARAKFDSLAGKANIATEWRGADGYPGETLIEHARCADLVVVGQRNPDADATVNDLPDGILLATGRPTLIVPNATTMKTFAKNVIVAWDGGAQATRALHDALPLMSAGAKISVIAVNPENMGDRRQIACADICRHLARHGYEAEARTVVASNETTADTLLSCAFEQGHDLLVMGAYGHSRFREFVFGGVTARALEKATLPVLMSH
jgi:nucleotide-binding universal stress UspA family protein